MLFIYSIIISFFICNLGIYHLPKMKRLKTLDSFFFAPFAGLKLAENTVPAELLWEKNTVPTKKKSNKPNMG